MVALYQNLGISPCHLYQVPSPEQLANYVKQVGIPQRDSNDSTSGFTVLWGGYWTRTGGCRPASKTHQRCSKKRPGAAGKLVSEVFDVWWIILVPVACWPSGMLWNISSKHVHAFLRSLTNPFQLSILWCFAARVEDKMAEPFAGFYDFWGMGLRFADLLWWQWWRWPWPWSVDPWPHVAAWSWSPDCWGNQTKKPLSAQSFLGILEDLEDGKVKPNAKPSPKHSKSLAGCLVRFSVLLLCWLQLAKYINMIHQPHQSNCCRSVGPSGCLPDA